MSLAQTQAKQGAGGSWSVGLVVLVLAVGAVIGTVVTVVIANFFGSPHKHVVAKSVETDEPAGVATTPAAPLTAVANPNPGVPFTQPTAIPVAVPPPANVDEPPEPIEAQKARVIEEHRAMLDAHAREPLNRSWARATETTLQTDLGPVAKLKHFDITSVDCRTTTCVATLTFPNYGAANDQWSSVLTARNHAQCSTEITLEDAADPSQPYPMTVVYDCTPQANAGAPVH